MGGHGPGVPARTLESWTTLSGSDSRGWQHEMSFRVEELFRKEQVFAVLSDFQLCAVEIPKSVRGRDGVIGVPDLPGDEDRFPFVPGPLGVLAGVAVEHVPPTV